MTREEVEELESLVEQSLAKLMQTEKARRILSKSSAIAGPRIAHLMAKAAVTVLEATEQTGE